MAKQRNWVEWIKKLPPWVIAAIGFVTAIVSFLILFRDNFYLVVTTSGALLLIAMWLGCWYAAFARDQLPDIETPTDVERKKPYRFSRRVRRLGWTGLVVIPGLALAFLFWGPTSDIISIAAFGTATPTPTLTPTSTPTATPTPTSRPTATPTPTSTPTLTPTPTPIIRPAVEGEILIVVFILDRPENLDFDPQPRIYTGLESAVNDVVGIDIRLERYDQIVTSQAEANSIREQFAATLVVWGFYDSKGIALRYTINPEAAVLDSLTLQPQEMAAVEIGQVAYDLYVGRDVSPDAAFVGLLTLAQALQASKRYDDAHELYTQAINEASSLALDLPGRSDLLIVAHTQRGVISEDYLGRSEEAYSDYRAATQLEPKTESAIPYRYRSVAYRRLGDVEAAKNDLREAISRDKRYVYPYLDLALLAYRSGDYTEANRQLNITLELDPQLAIAYYYKGVICYHRRDLSHATEEFSRAIETAPDLYVAYYFRAVIAYDTGNHQQAIKDINITISAIKMGKLPNFGRPILIRGMIYTDMRKPKMGIEDLTSVIEMFPDLQLAHFFRGLDYLQQEEFDAAVDDFTQALESNIRPAESLFNRGLAYFWLEDYEAALRDFNEVIREDEHAISAIYFFRGLIYETQGYNTLALNDFSRVIKLDPSNAAGYYHRGINYYERLPHHRRRLREAKQDFRKVISIDPDFAPAYYYLGQIAVLKGDLERAEWRFDQARERLPDYSAPWLGLTELYLEKGDRERAQEAYQKYKELGGKPVPDYEGMATSQ
jgi:tetratricopeptide (TPR) repeat protein